MSNLTSSILELEKKTFDAKILEILMKENGFAAEDLGTYFYKDVLKGIIFSLRSIQFDAANKKSEIMDESRFEWLVSLGTINENISQEQLCFLIDKEMMAQQQQLISELQQPNSMFYYNVARNFANVDLETFHKHIQQAASKTPLKSNYKIAAYHIGTYISNLPDETIGLVEHKRQGARLELKKG